MGIVLMVTVLFACTMPAGCITNTPSPSFTIIPLLSPSLPPVIFAVQVTVWPWVLNVTGE